MNSLNAVSDDLLFQNTIYRATTGDLLITSWSCGVFYQDIFDGQLIASNEAWFFPKPDFGFNLLIFKA